MKKNHRVISLRIDINAKFADYSKVREAFAGHGLFKAIKHIIKSVPGMNIDDFDIKIYKVEDD